MEQALLTKKLSIKEILSFSWKIYKTNFNIIFITVFAIYFPINFILSFLPQGDISENSSDFFNYLKYSSILEGFLGIITTIAIALIVKNFIEKKHIKMKELLKQSITVWPAVLGTSILLGLWLGLYFLIIIPGIIFFVYWMFSIYVAIFKKIYFKKAMNYSKKLVKGRWIQVFLYSLTFVLLLILTISVSSILFSIINKLFLNISLITIITDTFLNIIATYYSVVFIIFFINLDNVSI